MTRPPETITATVDDLDRFDTVIDVRSPAEFAEDHVPGAISCPVLDDAERALVGTMYKQESPFAARKVGAALVARNIAKHIETQFMDRPKTWRPLVYCWRGGQRSGAMTIVLRQIGWDARQLDGGYKAFRRVVIAGLEALPVRLDLRVLAGLTGSGKSCLLRALARHGAQVLDLEALAAHRGSLLGNLPDEPQPAQKGFETAVWSAMRSFDPARPVFVESESRRIGVLRVPEVLIGRMREAPCLRLDADTSTRVALLMGEYSHFFTQPAQLAAKLDGLIPLHGHEPVRRWRQQIDARDWPGLVAELLEQHYDPAYSRSIHNHFVHYARAVPIRISAAGDAAFDALAESLVRSIEPAVA